MEEAEKIWVTQSKKEAKKPGSLWFLLFFSFIAGMVNGLFGAGGGIVLILMLQRVLGEKSEKMRFAISCVAVFFFSALSLAVYAYSGTLSFQAASPYILPALIGGTAGGLLLRVIRTSWLKTLFALLLIYGGIRMVLS